MTDEEIAIAHQLARTIFSYAGSWAPTGIVEIALMAAAWTAAFNAGVTPREILDREFRHAPTDDEWHEKTLPLLEQLDRESLLHIESILRRN